jgi:Domain of unknown function DUF29
MIQPVAVNLSDLYEQDETAWLEAMADLIQQGRCGDLDYPHLLEYLTDIARRDRREVESRLIVLIVHVLKWVYQPDHRSRSWRATVVEQRQELSELAGQGVLRKHAETILPQAYAKAVERAVAETGLAAGSYPTACPYTLDQLLAPDLLAD